MTMRRSILANGRQKSKAALDRLFAQKIKARDGFRCRLCGSGTVPQCAHLMSRRYSNTRWDMENAWCLCRGCHFRYTKRPDEWAVLLEKTLGREALDMLRARAFQVVKPDYAAVRLYLERVA